MYKRSRLITTTVAAIVLSQINSLQFTGIDHVSCLALQFQTLCEGGTVVSKQKSSILGAMLTTNTQTSKLPPTEVPTR